MLVDSTIMVLCLDMKDLKLVDKENSIKIGVEVFGEKSPILDAEVIAMGYNFLTKLGNNWFRS